MKNDPVILSTDLSQELHAMCLQCTYEMWCKAAWAFADLYKQPPEDTLQNLLQTNAGNLIKNICALASIGASVLAETAQSKKEQP